MAISILSISLLFFLGHALRWVFIRTKIPDLLFLMLLGYLAGPVFGYVKPEFFGKLGEVLSTFALVVILYEGGLTLRARDLVSTSLPALKISLLGYFLAITLGFALAFLIAGQTREIAMLFGLGIGSTSSAVVIPLIKHLEVKDFTKTTLSLESAFTDVLTIVVFLVMVDGVKTGNFSFSNLLIGIGPKTLLAIALGLLSGLLWAFLRKKFNELTSMTFAGEAWALLVYGLMELFELNGVMGVLALGFILGNLDLTPALGKRFFSMVPISYKDQALLGELTFLLKTTFFLYLGLILKLDNLWIILFAVLVAIVIYISRYFATRALFSAEQMNRKESITSIAMGPRGLACAVLATIPLQRGIPGAEWLQAAMFALIPFSIIFTAVLVFLSENKSFRMSTQKILAKYPETPLEPAAAVVPLQSDNREDQE